MTAQEALAALETPATGTAQTRSYAQLKPADALSHLNETITAEVERFEKDVGLRLVSVKVTRCKEDDVLKTVQAHVR